jgi:hypothetical protein
MVGTPPDASRPAALPTLRIWIASSQELLAMTHFDMIAPYPANHFAGTVTSAGKITIRNKHDQLRDHERPDALDDVFGALK